MNVLHRFPPLTVHVPPKARTTVTGFPRGDCQISFVIIRPYSALPAYAFVDSFQIDHEEFIWPYPEKQFPVELFMSKDHLPMKPELRALFRNRTIRAGSRVTVGIQNTTPEPLKVAVAFEWLEDP